MSTHYCDMYLGVKVVFILISLVSHSHIIVGIRVIVRSDLFYQNLTAYLFFQGTV